MPTLKDHFIATRPWSLSMSAISVSLGTFLAWEKGPIHWGWYAAVVAGMVFCHAGGNVLNDYFDAKSGVDRPESPTAKYRPHPILAGLFSPRAVLAGAVVLFVPAGLLGLGIVLFRAPSAAWVALVGLFLAVSYTGPPLRLKYRALGEGVVFLIWGPLMFEGAYVVQRNTFSVQAVVASVPFGALVALVLFANNIRDIQHDRASGIRTLGTLLGPERSLRAFSALIVGAYLFTVGAVWAGALSPWSLLVLLSVPTAVSLLRSFRHGLPDAADALTAELNTAFGLLFLAGLWLDRAVGS